MRVPISKRLLCCAGFVQSGARVADIGTDHGYLGIYLLQQGIAASVAACDLREKPLQRARINAEHYQVDGQMEFYLADGLAALQPEQVDTIVCAGMGGDLIVRILSAAPWLRDTRYRLILQPQSAGQELRAWLAGQGFFILRETLVRDGGFLYTVLEACYGRTMTLTPGQQYVSPMLCASGSELLPAYIRRIHRSLADAVAGMGQAECVDPERYSYYQTALREVALLEEQYGSCF